MTAILIDDEQIAIDRLEVLLNDHTEIEVLGGFTCPIIGKAEIIRQQPDIVFTDVEMPKMSGLDLARAIKLVGVKSKIVFVTGFGHYAIKAIREAAFDYLVKPVDIEELKQTISRLSDGILSNESRIENISIEFSLTDRERDVLALLLKGSKSQDMANTLFLSKHTINTHRKNLLMKLEVASTQDLLLKYFS
ncbi:MAG: response regulator transcription factor [Bacteroidales bacterium]|nr:response regulator transcription factor [Bacteroidales bacterium]MCF8456939.1 response regulator transcription factor [Bacteroidales bacterium]